MNYLQVLIIPMDFYKTELDINFLIINNINHNIIINGNRGQSRCDMIIQKWHDNQILE